jgi:hypothetical protein
MQRRRMLIVMSQDDRSSFCLRGPRLFVTLAMVQGANRGLRGTGDAPRRGDIWM